MKKFVKVLGLMAVALCLGFTLAACSDDVDGTYEYSVSEEGFSITMTLELKDGKFTMSFPGSDEKQEGTYKVDGEKITFTVDGESVEGTVKDGKITMALEEGEEAITFTKK